MLSPNHCHFALQKLWYAALRPRVVAIPTTTFLKGHKGHRWYIEIHYTEGDRALRKCKLCSQVIRVWPLFDCLEIELGKLLGLVWLPIGFIVMILVSQVSLLAIVNLLAKLESKVSWIGLFESAHTIL